MSSCEKRPYTAGLVAAEQFRTMCAGCYERWEFGGSLRRRAMAVGDIEHVVIPRLVAPSPAGGLFGGGVSDEAPRNLLWERLDLLLATGDVQRAAYGRDEEHLKPRWGTLMRGVWWQTWRHEIFTTTSEGWWATLALKTGPHMLSVELVTRLRERGNFVQEDGVMRYAKGNAKGQVYVCASEEEYFERCGVVWKPPQMRQEF